jgi:DNA-binding NarL/FixJ family response regulator
LKTAKRIVIADDHPIFRNGLKQLIEAAADLQVIGEAEDGAAALHLLKALQPDVAILDISMPVMDGLDVVREIQQRRLPVEIIFLTAHGEEAMFDKAVSLGVKGYVLKSSAVTDIVNCIRAVTSGQHYASPALTTFLFKRARPGQAAAQQKVSLDSLTPTERRILKLLAEFKTTKEIADQLCLSPRTIDHHRANIAEKLELRGSHALTKFAVRHESEL